MLKNGVEGAETCMELIAPHFNAYAFAHNSIAGLERVSEDDASVNDMGEALAFFYKVFDRAGPQVAFDEAPEIAQNMVLVLRDCVKAKIAAKGADPEDFNKMPGYC